MHEHITVPVADYERSKAFYARALEPLGYVVLLDWRDKRRAYFGLPGEPSTLWLVESDSPAPVAVRLVAPSGLADPLVDPDRNRVEVVVEDDASRRAA